MNKTNSSGAQAALTAAMAIQSNPAPSVAPLQTAAQLLAVQQDLNATELQLHWEAGRSFGELDKLPKHHSSRKREALRKSLRWTAETVRNSRAFARSYAQVQVDSLVSAGVSWQVVQHLIHVTDNTERDRLLAEYIAGRMTADKLKRLCAPWKAGNYSMPNPAVVSFGNQAVVASPAPGADCIPDAAVPATADAEPASPADPATADAQPVSQADPATADAQPASQADPATADAQPAVQADPATADAQPAAEFDLAMADTSVA